MNPQQDQTIHTVTPATDGTITMSVIPAAPLASASLFSRGKDSLSVNHHQQPFRAKETPYRTYASPTSSSAATDESKSCPPSSSPGASSGLSSAPRSADATTWKANLRAECVARVRQQRQALVQKLRGLDKTKTDASAATNNVSMNFTEDPSSSAAAAAALQSAQASLASSLRSIIDDELARHRSQALSPANLHSPSPISPFASTSSFSFPSSSSSSSNPIIGARTGALQSSSSVIQEAFGGQDENFLSSDEYLAIMEQMAEEVNREMEMDIQLEQQMFHNSGQAASSSTSSLSVPSLPKSPSPDEQFLLAQQYAREAAEAMEAEQAACEEFEMYSTPSSVPCPCCHQSSSVTFQNQFASCSCGLRYHCESLQQFKQQLSDAFEVHAVKCQLQPKFISTPNRVQHHLMGSSSISVHSYPPANPLALACEKCQTWLTLPVEVGAWNSNPNSQQDQEMTD